MSSKITRAYHIEILKRIETEQIWTMYSEYYQLEEAIDELRRLESDDFEARIVEVYELFWS